MTLISVLVQWLDDGNSGYITVEEVSIDIEILVGYIFL